MEVLCITQTRAGKTGNASRLRSHQRNTLGEGIRAALETLCIDGKEMLLAAPGAVDFLVIRLEFKPSVEPPYVAGSWDNAWRGILSQPLLPLDDLPEAEKP